MKVSKQWLQELVDVKAPQDELEQLITFRIQGGTKEITDTTIELDLKGYNRADLLAMRGVAYEVAALTNSAVNFKELTEEEFVWSDQTLPEVAVQVEDTKLTPIYCVAKIEGITVAPSPLDWVKKLADSGMRSINTIADITNLVMLEYGQPLHAFDAAKVSNETIIVRTAKVGEELKTLDNKVRKLSSTDQLITDPQKPIGMAGVMGGKDSEITDETTTILLEAAIFDPISIRKTAQAQGLPSEASKRFQHGLTKVRLLQAFNAAIQMYQDLGGKLTALTITGEYADKQQTITLRQSKLNLLIGLEIEPTAIEQYLTSLRFQIKPQEPVILVSEAHPGSNPIQDSGQARMTDAKVWEVTPPVDRLDLLIEEDIIEEVARMYGYEKIPAKALTGVMPEKIDQKVFNKIKTLKEQLVAAGLTELLTYSFYSTKILSALDKDTSNLIKVLNPMSKETEYLRDELWPNLLEKTVENLKYFEDIAVFEIGKVYTPTADGTPEEEYRLSIAISNNSDNPVEELIALFQDSVFPLQVGIQLTEPAPGSPLESHLYHPTRYLSIKKNDQVMGQIAEIHPRIINSLGSDKRIAVLELHI